MSVNDERETVINFDESCDIANVYTFNGKLIRMFDKACEEYPELCCVDKVYDYGAKSYNVKKDRLSVRFKKPISEERKIKMSERAKNILHKND